MIARASRWVDDRLGLSRFTRSSLNKVFPDHWSFMLGEVAMYAFVVLLVTGVFLTFFFDPSSKAVVYHGHYHALDGVSMSEAYRSTLRLSWDVRAGLVMRQLHHWAALLFIAAIIAHVCRIFFTGAFRRPRELNWIIGVTLLLLAVANGFTGYSMPDDLLSGTGLRIAYSIALSIPVAGTWITYLVFGGEFPADQIITRLFVIHIMIVPALILGLLGAHLAIVWRQKHTQFPGRGKTESNVVGSQLWPTYTVKSVGLFAGVLAVLAALAGLAQINPIWLYGPFHAPSVSTAAQPDWYIGWLEGALRLFPPWEIRVWHHTIPNAFFPGVLLPGVTFALLYAWPFLEARMTSDRAEHHLLDPPRARPVRTAMGVATLSFYGVLLLAGGQDIFAQKLHVSIIPVTNTFRALLLVVPVLAAWVAWKLARDLNAKSMLDAEDRGDDDDGASEIWPTPEEDKPATSGELVSVGGPPLATTARAGALAVTGAATAAAVGWFVGRRRRR